jgi:hypothetical protein
MSFAPLIATVLAWGLLGLALILFAIGRWSHRWPKAKGVIKVAILDREPGETEFDAWAESFYLAYSFTVDGCEYLASSIKANGDVGWSTNLPGINSARDKAKRFQEGQPVEVYYCPFTPKWSCLERGGIWAPLLALLVSAVAFLIARLQ